ncbi:MAG TPA: tRNA (N6-threonylcarbamoyladenosine(37)-N6)-methyltransferase TrmO [Streptosporangiaceae bacterium]
MDATVSLRVIGVVSTGRADRESTPIQAALNRSEHGTVQVDPAYADGLDGLADCDYAWLLTWLDAKPAQLRPPRLRLVPFLLRPQQREVGIFATRSPNRVNRLGLSLVQILDVTAGTIRFAGVDMLDGTPILDIKPYVSRFDRPPGDPRCGWFDQVAIGERITPADLGPEP